MTSSVSSTPLPSTVFTETDRENKSLSKTYFGLFLLQSASVCLYGLYTDYSPEMKGGNTQITSTIDHYYPFFQDVHVMIFVGFGFLMTFTKNYAYSSVGFNFLLAAISLQYAILINGFFHNLFNNNWHKIDLNIESLITGDFAAGAILITYGALLGKTSLEQLLVMVPLQLIFYAVNESIGVIIYKAVDMGGSMYVHTFGAYFGLACSYVITKKKVLLDSKVNNLSSRESNQFAMIGTLFLWMFWPSFNGALALGNAQHRVVINTVLSLSNSCIFAFIVSKVMRRKFSMEDIQNATLAGGVAVGSSADLVIGPYAALIVGGLAGSISVVGYVHGTEYLESKCGIHDTCGVNNLHGVPGIIGGLIGAISAATASEKVYGDSITDIFSERDTRSALEQAGFQLAALGTSIFISIVGGLFTGKCMKYINNNRAYYKDVDWE